MRAKAVHSMTEGPLARSILAFSCPLMLSNVLQALFNMSDIAVVGRFAGAEALGSVGSTAILVTLFTGFLIGVGSGVNAVTARFLGARQHKDVEETVHTAFLLCLIIGLVEMALGQIFARPLLELLHTKDELIDGATLYLRIYLLGIPAAAMYNYGNGVLSAAGDTKNPLYILTIAGVVNVILKRILSRNILSIEKSCAFPFNNNLPGLLRLQTKIGWHCCKHFLSATVPICLCFSFSPLNIYT